jgi:hypothetical protein
MIRRFEVAVVSTRSHQAGGRAAMAEWLQQHGTNTLRAAMRKTRLYFPEVKPPALMTIDDRARRFDGPGTFPSVGEIQAFQPWFKRGKSLDRPIDEILWDGLTNSSRILEGVLRQNRRLRWTTAVSTIFSVAAVLFATLVFLGRL